MSDSEQKIIDINMSEMKAAANPHKFRSTGIGSCVVITLYDPIKRAGAMAHPMLAEPTPQKEREILRENDAKGLALISREVLRDFSGSLRYVEQAIDAMISALEKLGASRKRLEAKIIGGASMFKVFDKNPESIGAHNVNAAVKKLEKEGIKVIATDTGENCGRSVLFDLTNGIVEVKTKI